MPTFGLCVRTKKCEHHAVAGRQPNQFVGHFSGAELIGVADDLIQAIRTLALLIDEQLRKLHDVHEQDMPNFKFSITFELSGHVRDVRGSTDNHFNSISRREQTRRLFLQATS